jgi:hypothetical protein
VTDQEIVDTLDKMGLGVDFGVGVGGPFIPDGIVRIYHSETLWVVSFGDTLQEAYDNYVY